MTHARIVGSVQTGQQGQTSRKAGTQSVESINDWWTVALPTPALGRGRGTTGGVEKERTMFVRFARSTRRRAASAVLALVTVPVLIGFAALTVDVGVLYNTRVDLQNAADAAAMAATSALASEAMMQVRMGTSSASESLNEVVRLAFTQTQSLPGTGYTFGGKKLGVEAADVTIGWLDTASATEPIKTGASPSTFNAIQVVVRRTRESVNGPVELFFARIFGRQDADVVALAVAVLDDHFSGYDADQSRTLLWPFTKHINEYEAQLQSGEDRYGYDSESDTLTSGPDGTREVRLYPGDEAPGNYGLLNIGPTDLSLDELRVQILNGITADDMEATFGATELSFYDETGAPTPYDSPGNAGLKAQLEDAVQARVGDVVGFFVHNEVLNSGSNVVYKVIGIRWGRVMHAALQTSAKDRGVWIQPVTYDGPGVFTHLNAPPSWGAAGRVVLSR
jgi:Flp pilus assembly protein TadG